MTDLIFNIFDETTSQKMQLDERVMPKRIESLMDEDFVILPQYCGNAPEQHDYLVSFRMDAVETIYQMALDLRLGTPAAWSAIRLFDMFYSTTSNPNWQLHMPMVAAVCMDVAGKCISYDMNPCGNPKTVEYMYDLICNDKTVTCLEKFRQFFAYIEGVVLNTLKFNILIPTPDEYLSECSRWYDGTNAARGSPTRPESELKVARMTSYIIAAIMYSPDSMAFTALEIGGYASYLATSPNRTAPQTHYVDPPHMKGLWTMVAWTRGNKLSEILVESVENICKKKPMTVLGMMYPDEHEQWKSTCSL